MIVVACTLKLYLPTAHSLKNKRGIIKSLTTRAGREFNVSIAEVDGHDLWQTAWLGIATVSNNKDHACGRLERVIEWIERTRPDVQILDVEIEIM